MRVQQLVASSQNFMMPRVISNSAAPTIYAWDVAFCAATVVGFFGGGGMGWYLKRNIQQLENTKGVRDHPVDHRCGAGCGIRFRLAASPGQSRHLTIVSA
jgi:ABC-type phosphate/phosphonate transport system permease subunit